MIKGKSFCFTGALDSMSRAEARRRLEKLGGIFKSSIVSGLDYLVTNDPFSGSIKSQKALGYGITMLDESEFLEMLKAAESD